MYSINKPYIDSDYLADEDVENDIRSMEVSNLVSPVSKIQIVRDFLVKQQQEIGLNKGVVMDGRDIGTVVFPDAELKIFMTANAEIRAQRRFNELKENGNFFPSKRTEFEKRSHDLLARVEAPVLDALKKSGLRLDDIE
jgi:cytidylate kinase